MDGCGWGEWMRVGGVSGWVGVGGAVELTIGIVVQILISCPSCMGQLV